MSATSSHQLVRLASGAFSVRAVDYGETMHPGLGPAAEAEALYVGQLDLRRRMAESAEEFVVWDVGLGAAANATAVLRAGCELANRLRLVSFDDSTRPLEFALQHGAELPFLAEYRTPLSELPATGRSRFTNGAQEIEWTLVLADFPAWLQTAGADACPAPHAILFDPFSPARNPAMWTREVFRNLHRRLDAARPCALATYSRSTLVRAALLLAGFFVGTGAASGAKEETTVAANSPSLVPRLLDRAWLQRARRSDCAEPLREAVYRRAPLSEVTWRELQAHPQFR